MLSRKIDLCAREETRDTFIYRGSGCNSDDEKHPHFLRGPTARYICFPVYLTHWACNARSAPANASPRGPRNRLKPDPRITNWLAIWLPRSLPPHPSMSPFTRPPATWHENGQNTCTPFPIGVCAQAVCVHRRGVALRFIDVYCIFMYVCVY